VGPEETASLLEAITALRAAAADELGGGSTAADSTDDLVALLTPHLPAPPSPVARALDAATGHLGWLAGILAAIRPQVRILRGAFWLASAVIVLAGLPLISPAVRTTAGTSLTYSGFLLLVAPLMAALGVAYAFRSAGTGMAELELTCPLSPLQLVLGRLFWVATYDAALLGAASVVAAGYEPRVNLAYLVIGWLMPMLVMAAATLALSLYVSLWLSAVLTLGLWGSVLAVGLGRPALFLPALAGSSAILPTVAVCAVGLVVLLGAVVAASPRLAVRLAGLAVAEGEGTGP
jgi:hypothetical protein